MRARNCVTHGQINCGCGKRMERCKCNGPVPIQYIMCIHDLTPQELFNELVDNAAAFEEEHPYRMVKACQIIARSRRCKPDDVFKEIRAQVKERTGMERLPGEALNMRLN